MKSNADKDRIVSKIIKQVFKELLSQLCVYTFSEISYCHSNVCITLVRLVIVTTVCVQLQ